MKTSTPTQHKEKQILEKMQDDFKRASEDKEILDLSEWGMDDYNEIVTS
jgi:hypothetical protein